MAQTPYGYQQQGETSWQGGKRDPDSPGASSLAMDLAVAEEDAVVWMTTESMLAELGESDGSSIDLSAGNSPPDGGDIPSLSDLTMRQATAAAEQRKSGRTLDQARQRVRDMRGKEDGVEEVMAMAQRPAWGWTEGNMTDGLPLAQRCLTCSGVKRVVACISLLEGDEVDPLGMAAIGQSADDAKQGHTLILHRIDVRLSSTWSPAIEFATLSWMARNGDEGTYEPAI
ncbi:hypothetical protein VTK73DRAFT_1793 [Phialemonium thermophilum]|uniref:Uncharacterized protein n=1 Tax=Phialemonium thermophilum TaxID=223376 RepID=A0ABR3VSZ0_9PEZI